MSKAFCIDLNRCTGCSACVVTCKDKCDLRPGINNRHVSCDEFGTFPNVSVTYSSWGCNNCENPACVENCPKGAMTQDKKNGIVFVNTDKCVGCGTCARVCPFSVPTIDEEIHKSRKCDYCVDLLMAGENPACVDVCNARALYFGELEDLQEEHPNAERMEGETNPRTLVIYKN